VGSRPTAVDIANALVSNGHGGLLTAFRAMSNAEPDFRYTLHRIDENFDAGAIVDFKTGGE
jgi:methionyl-tRNA formyltransferase